jgi:transposase-like protein
MSEGRRGVYSREFKLSAVKRLLAGESAAALSLELGLPKGPLYKCQHLSIRRG